MSFKTYEVRVFDDGSKYWYLDGKRHREDGPAVEWADGSKYWCLNGQLHREDGPACEGADGSKFWWLNGQPMTEAEHAAKTRQSQGCYGKVVEIDGRKYKLTEV